jgi:hypothetical protein
MNADECRYAPIGGMESAGRSQTFAQTRAWMRANYFFWGFSFTLHAALLAPLAIKAALTACPGIPPFAADFVPLDPAPVEWEQLDSIGGEPTVDCFCCLRDIGPPQSEVVPPERSVVVKRQFDRIEELDPQPSEPWPVIPPPARFGTGETQAIVGAVYWIAHHQSGDGSWSLQKYNHECLDASCTGIGEQESRAAGTGLALLALQGAGQTHRNGPFQRQTADGIYWLISHQRSDGDLSSGGEPMILSHAIATLALSEDYYLTNERAVGVAAQRGINFIESTFKREGGALPYDPRDRYAAIVLAWQIMALKSAQFAGLNVDRTAFEGAKQWLSTPSAVEQSAAANCRLASVRLFCDQCRGVPSDDPIVEPSV